MSWLGLFQLLNIRLPFEISLLETEVFYRDVELIGRHFGEIIIQLHLLTFKNIFDFIKIIQFLTNRSYFFIN